MAHFSQVCLSINWGCGSRILLCFIFVDIRWNVKLGTRSRKETYQIFLKMYLKTWLLPFSCHKKVRMLALRLECIISFRGPLCMLQVLKCYSRQKERKQWFGFQMKNSSKSFPLWHKYPVLLSTFQSLLKSLYQINSYYFCFHIKVRENYPFKLLKIFLLQTKHIPMGRMTQGILTQQTCTLEISTLRWGKFLTLFSAVPFSVFWFAYSDLKIVAGVSMRPTVYM